MSSNGNLMLSALHPFLQKPKLRETGIDELTLYGIRDVPAFYADGKRSILDISNAFAAEYMPAPLNLFELYFRAFEEAGVMKLTEKK